MNNNINRPQREDQGVIKKPNVFYILAFFTALIMLAMYGLGEMDFDFKNEFKKMKQEIVDNINNDGSPVVGGYSNETTTTAAVEPATTQPVDPNATQKQQKALRLAYSYLKFSAYSKEGLKDRIMDFNITEDVAEYAVNNCGADWVEQARKKAEEYTKFKKWKRIDLQKQLENDKFEQDEINEALQYISSKVGLEE